MGNQAEVSFMQYNYLGDMMADEPSMTGCVESIIIRSVNPAAHDQDR